MEHLIQTGDQPGPGSVLQQAIRANIRVSVNGLRNGSGILERLIEKDEVTIVGAEYSFESGVVEFFDGVPDIK